MTTTNYYNTFISVADDCPLAIAEVPPFKKDNPSAARLQFDLIEPVPYRYSSDEVLFAVHARKKGITAAGSSAAREAFFSKGQPCLRASPLTKRYGWGVHCAADGQAAIDPLGSESYIKLSQDKNLTQVKAMRSSRG